MRCKQKTFNVLERSLSFDLMAKKSDIPINVYSMVQTGPKIQLGGLKNGLLRPKYQESIAENVNKLPISPADCAAKTQRIKVKT